MIIGIYGRNQYLLIRIESIKDDPYCKYNIIDVLPKQIYDNVPNFDEADIWFTYISTGNSNKIMRLTSFLRHFPLEWLMVNFTKENRIKWWMNRKIEPKLADSLGDLEFMERMIFDIDTKELAPELKSKYDFLSEYYIDCLYMILFEPRCDLLRSILFIMKCTSMSIDDFTLRSMDMVEYIIKETMIHHVGYKPISKNEKIKFWTMTNEQNAWLEEQDTKPITKNGKYSSAIKDTILQQDRLYVAENGYAFVGYDIDSMYPSIIMRNKLMSDLMLKCVELYRSAKANNHNSLRQIAKTIGLYQYGKAGQTNTFYLEPDVKAASFICSTGKDLMKNIIIFSRKYSDKFAIDTSNEKFMAIISYNTDGILILLPKDMIHVFHVELINYLKTIDSMYTIKIENVFKAIISTGLVCYTGLTSDVNTPNYQSSDGDLVCKNTYSCHFNSRTPRAITDWYKNTMRNMMQHYCEEMESDKQFDMCKKTNLPCVKECDWTAFVSQILNTEQDEFYKKQKMLSESEDILDRIHQSLNWMFIVSKKSLEKEKDKSWNDILEQFNIMGTIKTSFLYRNTYGFIRVLPDKKDKSSYDTNVYYQLMKCKTIDYEFYIEDIICLFSN